MNRTAVSILANHACRVICINPTTKEILQSKVALDETESFANFCYNNGLSWLFSHHFSLNESKKSLIECISSCVSKNQSKQVSKMCACGFSVTPIGDTCYMLALECDSAPKDLVGSSFCHITTKKKYCQSALIFCLEKGEAKNSKYSQMDCPLSLEDVIKLYSFNCEEVVHTATTTLERTVQRLPLLVPRYYADTLLELGKALKNEPADLSSINYDSTVVSTVVTLPNFTIAVLKDLCNKLSAPLLPKSLDE